MPTSPPLPWAAHGSCERCGLRRWSRIYPALRGGGKAPTGLLHIAGGGKLGRPPNPPPIPSCGSGEAVPQALCPLVIVLPLPCWVGQLALYALRVMAPVL